METAKKYLAFWLSLLAFGLAYLVSLIQGVPPFVAFYRGLAGAALFYFVGKGLMGLFLGMLIEELSEYSSTQEEQNL